MMFSLKTAMFRPSISKMLMVTCQFLTGFVVFKDKPGMITGRIRIVICIGYDDFITGNYPEFNCFF